MSLVRRANKPLTTVRYKEAVEALLNPVQPAYDREAAEGENRLVERPPPRLSRPVEACSRYHGRLVAGVRYHPVVAAAHMAFMDHRPLTLSPDHVWLLIAQAVAHHINANAEGLRPRLVQHAGKLAICVDRPDFVKGSPENPWPEVFSAFSDAIREHVGPRLDCFLPDFSTTGPVERAAAEVVLLDAMQSFFRYSVRSYCGIPAITLEGTNADWQSIRSRLDAFTDLGLDAWIGIVRGILDQFVRASEGDVDVPFWESLYKYLNWSGGPRITGWITAFFPYRTDLRTQLPTAPCPGLLPGVESGFPSELFPDVEPRGLFEGGMGFSSLPSGLSVAPFLWGLPDRTVAMSFLGGFVGVAQDEQTLAVRPEIGWAIREAPAPR